MHNTRIVGWVKGRERGLKRLECMQSLHIKQQKWCTKNKMLLQTDGIKNS